MIPAVPAKLLEGKKGLIVGIANDHSIAWDCAKAFRALGCELAVTYINQKTKTYVEPLARELVLASTRTSAGIVVDQEAEPCIYLSPTNTAMSNSRTPSSSS
jgi:enoyl-[acyl-carrier-protein] reductase (NADH)